MTRLPILHFNDVYRVSPQKVQGLKETIDVTQFAALVDDLRGSWAERPEDGKRDGLTLFSGDLFSPSVESSVTRGSHMVPIMNEIGVDIALAGNHDFDFGYPHLTKLIQDSTYPWILSNIIDDDTSKTPKHLHPFQVFDRCGVRIGIIGLVEREWITTVSSWPPQFQYKSMMETGLQLSKLLRDPNGEYRCDIVIALTHSRLPSDIELAKQLLAFSPSAQATHSIANEHGVDIILGGHDHLYFVNKGSRDGWEGYDKAKRVLGAQGDNGDILVFKSGCDFRDLSELVLELEDTPAGSIRRKLIKKITGKRHRIRPEMRSSARLARILREVLSSVSSTMKAPVCRTATKLDLRSQYIRTEESAAANWIADVIRHAYDDALCLKGCGGADGTLICAGTLRGDSTYGPGIMTLGDILEILPFDDPVVVLELDGQAIWDALEAALSKWPAQEGRFPTISGLRVTWDSRLPPGQRVLSVSLEKREHDGVPSDQKIEEEPVLRQKDGRKYKIVTREYLAGGHDGFDALKGKPYLIDDESGSIMSSIVRKYLLGSQFVTTMLRAGEKGRRRHLSNSTQVALTDAIEEHNRRDQSGDEHDDKATSRWKHAIELVIHRARTRVHYQSLLSVSTTEHMSSVDPFDGSAARKGQECILKVDVEGDRDLLIICPEVDGRLRDLGRV